LVDLVCLRVNGKIIILIMTVKMAMEIPYEGTYP
jgi:hypothetical protein